MKFTKEDAYKDLVAKLTAKGEKLNLSERTLKQQLETLIKFVANDEMELEDFVKAVIDDVKSLDGQYRKDNSDFIKEWEKNHPTPAPTEPKPNPTPAQSGTENPEMKALLERLAALENESKAAKREKTISETKSNLKKALKDKGVKDSEWLDLMLQKVAITEDFDVEQESDYYLKLYNKSNPIPRDGVTPKGTNGGGENPQVNNSIKAASEMAKRKREEQERLLNN